MTDGDVDVLFDRLVSSSDGAILVVTVATDDERDGCLVGFHSQCSIEPRRYALWLSAANRTTELAGRASHVGVHLLAAGDHELAELFGGLTGDDVDKLASVAWRSGPGGVPLLDGCARRMVLARTELREVGGDHLLFVGEPAAAWAPAGSFTPLRLSDASDIHAGHPPGDRRSPGSPRAG
jgi:flavin reductase (DIM6/NTAB) family NADH-FMN oxidoreductase RutF